MEVELQPIATVFGGAIGFPRSDAPVLLHRHREWTSTLPETFTSSLAIGSALDRSDVPEHLREMRVVMLRGAFVGDPRVGRELVASFTQSATPLFDTFVAMPFSRIGSISNDPVEPSPALTLGGQMFEALPDALLKILADYASDADSPFVEIELRHIATASESRLPICYPHRNARYVLDVVAGAATDAGIAQMRDRGAELHASISRYSVGRFLNLADSARASDAFPNDALRRLEDIKKRFDPGGVFISGAQLSDELRRV